MNTSSKNVKYNKGKVTITMSIDAYAKMCAHFNVFNEAMNEFGESMDFRISEINHFDSLRYALLINMGWEKLTEGSYYSSYQIPTIKEK